MTEIHRGRAGTVIIDGKETPISLMPSIFDKEKEELKQKSVTTQLHLIKNLDKASKITLMLDAPEGTFPATKRTDRVMRQMDKQFNQIMRKVDRDKDILQQIADRQKEIRREEHGD